jgi:hypothetical protein
VSPLRWFKDSLLMIITEPLSISRLIRKSNTRYRPNLMIGRLSALRVGFCFSFQLDLWLIAVLDRLRTILKYDRILVLDSGNIVVSIHSNCKAIIMIVSMSTGIWHSLYAVRHEERCVPKLMWKEQYYRDRFLTMGLPVELPQLL